MGKARLLTEGEDIMDVENDLLGASAFFFDPYNHYEQVNRGNPHDVLVEVQKITSLISKQFDFNQVQQVFDDIIKLFNGTYPGYRQCNTMYHDLHHTMDCLLVTAQLIHGAYVNKIIFSAEHVGLTLISALMHDTGYLQSLEDVSGTGAKYTLCHVERSIHFLEQYFRSHGFPAKYSLFCSNLLRCTGLDVKIADIHFQSRQHEILGKILGTADLIGQMADKNYLKKLPTLFHEFQEGGVPGYESMNSLVEKTPSFWEMVKQRFIAELGSVDLYLRDHFRVCYGIDQDLHRQAIERNMKHLKAILDFRKLQDFLCTQATALSQPDWDGPEKNSPAPSY